ncbi:hypothetical protein THIX_60998 [Thiomonas sp. X19]|uniref:hypothetical protein n=1 Tax=Thiomonas sp. X19 TaxID=1050370 RepID=UPI000B6BDE2C|nr:hypothetical protein [Thiomonas sp. X19]SCC94940.1 hypothetical protein THIX_60998 [Thiomonas sp. X19]
MQREEAREALASLLDNINAINAAHISMKCPAHRGGLTASLEVTLVAGRLHMHCMCGCTQDQILAAVYGPRQEERPMDRFDEFINALAA